MGNVYVTYKSAVHGRLTQESSWRTIWVKELVQTGGFGCLIKVTKVEPKPEVVQPLV
jgi:hypothetical protein